MAKECFYGDLAEAAYALGRQDGYREYTGYSVDRDSWSADASRHEAIVEEWSKSDDNPFVQSQYHNGYQAGAQDASLRWGQ